MVSGSLTLSGGEFWSGTRSGYDINLSVRPAPGISFSSRFNRNEINFPDGDFTTNLGRLSAGWQLSPWAAFSGNVQYDDESEIVGLFMRTRWILQPGNELFLVFTQNWQNLGTGLFDRNAEFLTLSRGGSVKVNYTYRL